MLLIEVIKKSHFCWAFWLSMPIRFWDRIMDKQMPSLLWSLCDQHKIWMKFVFFIYQSSPRTTRKYFKWFYVWNTPHSGMRRAVLFRCGFYSLANYLIWSNICLIFIVTSYLYFTSFRMQIAVASLFFLSKCFVASNGDFLHRFVACITLAWTMWIDWHF